jgi:excisionase family DNA binding protein
MAGDKKPEKQSATRRNTTSSLHIPALTRVEFLLHILERRINNLNVKERNASEWTTRIAAKVSGKDANTIRNWISSGKILATPIGSRFLIDRESFLAFLKDQAAKSDEAAPETQ